jgi:hypothetical protein
LYGLLGIKTRLSEVTMMFVTKMDGAIRLTPPTPWYIFLLVHNSFLFFVFIFFVVFVFFFFCFLVRFWLVFVV